MSEPATNLQVQRPSRGKPREGDIFTMQLPDGTHLFGRVIRADTTDSRLAPMPGSYLIHIYRYRTESKKPDVKRLTTGDLLLPPVFINRMPWTKGYFETVGHAELTRDDLLERYCFWRAVQGVYVDENRNPLPHEIHPCGEWGLASYRLLDDLISDALGISKVPE